MLLMFDQSAVFETDTHGMLWLTLCSILMGIFTSSLLDKWFLRKVIDAKSWFQRSAAYIIGFFLLKYGWDKVVLLQFYTPNANILYSNFGLLSKDIAFWSLIGSSPLLSQLIGGIEIVIGLLLFLPRFRFLAALFSVGCFFIIFIVNCSFDISVKQFSFTCLMWSFLLMFSYPEKISVLIGKPGIPSLSNASTFTWIWIPVFILIGIEATSSTLKTGIFNFQQYQRVIHSKAYRILNHPMYKSVYVHQEGFLIVELHHETMIDFPMNKINGTYIVKNKTTHIVLSAQEFIENNKAYKIHELPVKSLHLLKNNIHFFSDEFH